MVTNICTELEYL